MLEIKVKEKEAEISAAGPPLELSAEAMLAIDSLINIVGRCLCVPYQVARDMTIRVCDARYNKKEEPK